MSDVEEGQIMTGHDSAFVTPQFDVTDPDTPVWNALVEEYRARSMNSQATGGAGSDVAEPQATEGAAGDSMWPLDENAEFHGVSHR